MTEQISRGEVANEATETYGRAAVGLVADGDDTDAIAGALLRARRHGSHVFLYDRGGIDSEASSFAEQVGATVLRPDDGPDGTAPRPALRRGARQSGFPGLLFQPDPAMRVDFEASEKRLHESDSYLVEAVEAPVVDSDPEVLIVIPAYNEAGTIARVVERAAPYADEVVVVDDGSEDATVERATEAGATVVEHGTNRGYGAALQTAFEQAERSGADHLVILDGDDQHDPSDIPRLLDRQRETEAHIVIGSRFVGDNKTDLPFYRRFGLGVVNRLTNMSLGSFRPEVRDTQCGFRAYDREAIESLAGAGELGDRMGASTDILYHAFDRAYDIEEVGTSVDYDVDDGSSHHPVRHGMHLVSNILRTIERKHPILILGVPGFVFALFGLGFGYWTFSNYLASGTFPVGLAITSAVFELGGIFACFTAIILHALNQLHD